MAKGIKHTRWITRMRKTAWYARARQYFPMSGPGYVDDQDLINTAEVIRIDWPAAIRKPRVGIVRDAGPFPRWTKYRRFLQNNSFAHDLFELHASDWLERAESFDIIVGFPSSAAWELEEFRRKYYVLETFLGKRCYPSSHHVNLYEDKSLEVYLAKIYCLPFVDTYICHDETEALRIIETLSYPVVSKINPSSGSMGVELVPNEVEARRIVRQAFSTLGRKIYTNHFRQKNYVYFQEFVPNDGYDLRIIVVGNRVFGYFRKVLEGDFRASGMSQSEMRELPEAAMRIALHANQMLRSPQLAVDMVHALDGSYRIIEYSPICQTELPEDLHVNGVPGVYIFDPAKGFHFEPGRYWLQELAFREFLRTDYLRVQERFSLEMGQAR